MTHQEIMDYAELLRKLFSLYLIVETIAIVVKAVGLTIVILSLPKIIVRLIDWMQTR